MGADGIPLVLVQDWFHMQMANAISLNLNLLLKQLRAIQPRSAGV